MSPFTAPLRRLAPTTHRTALPSIHPPAALQYRALQISAPRPSKKDDLMDKDSMETTSTEYSKSGGDGQAAHEGNAFDPSTTKPEDQTMEQESGGGGDNPLEVSPGNPEVSKPTDNSDMRERSPAEAEGRRRPQSGGGSPRKAGGGRSG